MLDLGGSVSDTVSEPGGRRTFFHVNADPKVGTRMHTRSALTSDAGTLQVEEGGRVRARAEEQITDPFVVLWRGGYKMYFKVTPARVPAPEPLPSRPTRRSMPSRE